MNSFLTWIYEANYTHDQMESASRDHTIIQLSGLVMVISLMLPMAICIDTNLDFKRTAWLIFSICIGIACAFRIPYKMGKLNAYASKKTKQKQAAQNEELNDLYDQIRKMEQELNDLKYNQFCDHLKNKNQEKFYSDNKNSYNNAQSKPKANDWRLKYLNILGLDSSATAEQIKATYRKLAMRWHPDRNPGNKQAEEKFKEMKQAYEHLCS